MLWLLVGCWRGAAVRVGEVGTFGSNRSVWERSARRFSLPNGTGAPKRAFRSHPGGVGGRDGSLASTGFDLTPYGGSGQDGRGRDVWERSARRFSLSNGTGARKWAFRSHPGGVGGRDGSLADAGFDLTPYGGCGQGGRGRDVWERSARRFSLPNGTGARKRAFCSHPGGGGGQDGSLMNTGL